jgi:hypothetical protein
VSVGIRRLDGSVKAVLVPLNGVLLPYWSVLLAGLKVSVYGFQVRALGVDQITQGRGLFARRTVEGLSIVLAMVVLLSHRLSDSRFTNGIIGPVKYALCLPLKNIGMMTLFLRR